MAWTPKQCTLFLIAAKAAGWNDDQRYIAMRHCGCPLKGGTPSVTHPRNDNAAYERCMALAESCAGQRGEHVPPPSKRRTWREAVAAPNERMRELAQRIANEAVLRLPAQFADNELLRKTIDHVCGDELVSPDPSSPVPGTLHSLDAGQLYRVVESLKAHVGRVLLEHGLTPESFTAPAWAKRRVAQRAAMEGAAG